MVQQDPGLLQVDKHRLKQSRLDHSSFSRTGIKKRTPSSCGPLPRLFIHEVIKFPFLSLKLLLLLEEHAEADDGPVDQKAAGDGHDHGFDSDQIGVREDNREGCGSTYSG